MLHLYYSNQLSNHAEILLKILKNDPNPNPFAKETILVQSIGMAQWLQRKIADELGIAANLKFPYPTRFLWEQYRAIFPELPNENLFERNAMEWRLMRLIPQYLQFAEFAPLNAYLNSPDQLKLYQLAAKVADLFDQYLVYRPHWLIHWEQNASAKIFTDICQNPTFRYQNHDEIEQNIAWQGKLWCALVEEIKKEIEENITEYIKNIKNTENIKDIKKHIFEITHRAHSQKRFFEKLENLNENDKQQLPQRVFVFGITALPLAQLAVLKALSAHCNVHLFFTNPSEVFWGDQREDRILEKLALNREIDEQEIQTLLDNQGNPLLASWGKQGKEFLNLILEQEPDNIIEYYEPNTNDKPSLLTQIKQAILRYEYQTVLSLDKNDQSLQIHACHSKMREVEVLHDQLLHLFEQHQDLTPNDIIVMSADIDSYAPYIDAVFSRYPYQDKRYIPFTLSDQKISMTDPIIKGFLSLLNLKEKRLSIDEILDFFNIPALRANYQLTESDLETLREWIQNSGIRAGLTQDNKTWQNYNSWENGLNRLLLGSSLKAESGQWQSLVGFDESYGLKAELVGFLAKFIETLTAWLDTLQQPQTIKTWKNKLNELLTTLFKEDSDNIQSLQLLNQAIEKLYNQIEDTHFEAPIAIEVLSQLFEQTFSEQRNNLNFLVGRVNFCTLLPMRAIPFKVVCLLGMNEGEFPRQQQQNSFNLMQYAQQKGDRAKRDDDRYLFLEALLSAQNVLYISYIGQSLTSNQQKLPSILVSQLLDYLAQNAEGAIQHIIQTHPMTAFSPQNFSGNHFSYNDDWLQALKNPTENTTFLGQLPKTENEIPNEIHLDQLIAYLQDPYRFFFNEQLGVNFEQYDKSVDKSEIFQLNGLNRYDFYEELLRVDEQDLTHYFELAKLKGNLPACHFGELAISELKETIKPMREALTPYLTKLDTLFEVDHYFHIDHQKIRLFGNIAYQFDNEIVHWRVGRLRDKDIICAWVYFLLLQTQPTPPAFKFYYREEKNAKCLTFKPIDPTEAEAQLACYIKDYLHSCRELLWVVNDGIANYLNKLNSQPEPYYSEQWLSTQENAYIQRILSQPYHINYNTLRQRTQDWFAKMIACAQI